MARHYERRVDELFDGAKPEPRGIRVLDEGDLLTLLGYGAGEVVLAENHVVNDGRNNHSLTKEDVKRIPEWLENPVAVFERPENGGSLTFVAYNERTHEPMLIAVEPTAERGPKGAVKFRHVTLTAYGSTRAPFARWAREGSMLYRNKKMTPAFNRDAGQRLPGGDEGLRGAEWQDTERARPVQVPPAAHGAACCLAA